MHTMYVWYWVSSLTKYGLHLSCLCETLLLFFAISQWPSLFCHFFCSFSNTVANACIPLDSKHRNFGPTHTLQFDMMPSVSFIYIDLSVVCGSHFFFSSRAHIFLSPYSVSSEFTTTWNVSLSVPLYSTDITHIHHPYVRSFHCLFCEQGFVMNKVGP